MRWMSSQQPRFKRACVRRERVASGKMRTSRSVQLGDDLAHGPHMSPSFRGGMGIAPVHDGAREKSGCLKRSWSEGAWRPADARRSRVGRGARRGYDDQHASPAGGRGMLGAEDAEAGERWRARSTAGAACR